jgi:hypothetical protein
MADLPAQIGDLLNIPGVLDVRNAHPWDIRLRLWRCRIYSWGYVAWPPLTTRQVLLRVHRQDFWRAYRVLTTGGFTVVLKGEEVRK